MKLKQKLAITATALILTLSALTGYGIRANAATQTDELPKSMHSVADAYALVEKNYADKISAEKAFYQGAIPGMLRTLDPHSNFVDPAEYREMQRKQRAQYFGVGMLIGVDTNNKIVVMEPFPGSPAWKADLRRGDTIFAVDGKQAGDLPSCKTSAAQCSADVAGMLRGPKGTIVKVTVKREGVADPVTAEVTRGEISTSIVDAYWYKPGIVYLRIDSFEAQNVAHDVEEDLHSLGEQNVTGMILDLRGNPGGLVNEAVNVAGRFLRDGQIVVSHRGRAEQEQVFRAKANALAQKYPIVVLVDNRSASAAEIVSGALQDHDRAWIMGDTTFGKGLVQAQFPLSEGAALLLTIAHYYTPSGRLIQRDYSHESFLDYYYAKHDGVQNSQDIKSTDGGRKVYGGGGITPDEKYASQHLNLFQRKVLSFATGQNTFYHFGNVYFGGNKPILPMGWQPDQNTLERFKTFLKSQNISFTDDEFNANRDWVSNQIKYELLFRAFDRHMAERAQWSDDPEIKKAIESLPRAQSLLMQVQRVLAQRGARG
jgi:carboxyl-terminal processing protease